MKLAALIVVGAASALLVEPNVLAQDAQNDQIEEVIVVGSRFETSRSAAEATAPVDVLSSEQIGSVGNHADLTTAFGPWRLPTTPPWRRVTATPSFVLPRYAVWHRIKPWSW